MLDLDTLVAPLGAESFLAGPWPDDAWWAESSPERAQALTGIEQLAGPEALLTDAQGILVFKPDGTLARVPDGQAALKLYAFGLTLYVPNTNHIPALAEFADALNSELGMPAGSVKTEIFCSSGDSGAKMHSDHDVNFALLVRGHKRWTFAPNRHVRNQTGPCAPSSREAPSPVQLDLADETPFPAAMPDDAIVVEVTDGGVIFLPRGWWHETKANGDCLQVNFVINRPMWMNLASRAFERHLLTDVEWRGYAHDLHADAQRREAALAHLTAMVPELRKRAAQFLDGDDADIARRIAAISEGR